MTVAEAKAGAREMLASRIVEYRNRPENERALGVELVNEALDAFAAAVRAEAFEEMRAEVERRFELNSAEPGFGPSGQAIAYGRLADWAKQQSKKGRD
jgi:hypothetical protein